MYKRILVPIDGSHTATQALIAALQLARDGGGRVRLLHVLEDRLAADSDYGGYAGNLVQALRQAADRVLGAGLAVAQSAGVEADHMVCDNSGERLGSAVAEAAMRWNADLIVVGTHGRRGLERVLLGSGAEQIIRQTPVPVLVFRATGDTRHNTA